MIACGARRISAIEAVTTVSDVPFVTDVSGYTTAPGVGHEPEWMCAGCGPAALLSVMTTLVPAPSDVRTAVPVWPELFCGDSAIVTLCCASVLVGRSAIVVRATAKAPINGSQTALTIPPPRD